MVITMALTVATWIVAVPFERQIILSALAGIVTLIGTPAAVAVTLYQLSKYQNRAHHVEVARLNNGNGNPVEDEPEPEGEDDGES